MCIYIYIYMYIYIHIYIYIYTNVYSYTEQATYTWLNFRLGSFLIGIVWLIACLPNDSPKYKWQGVKQLLDDHVGAELEASRVYVLVEARSVFVSATWGPPCLRRPMSPDPVDFAWSGTFEFRFVNYSVSKEGGTLIQRKRENFILGLGHVFAASRDLLLLLLLLS